MPEYDALSVRLNKETMTLEQIDKRAEELSLNRSQLVTLALQMMVNFDPKVLKTINRYSQKMNIPEWMVIQNITVHRLAEKAAEQIVWGTHEDYEEFSRFFNGEESKMITGEELYKKLCDQYVLDEKRAKINNLIQAEDYGAIIELDEEDKNLLAETKSGIGWLNSEKRQKLIADRIKARNFVEDVKKEGLLPEDFALEFINVPINSVVSSILDMEKGKTTKEKVIEELKSLYDQWNANDDWFNE